MSEEMDYGELDDVECCPFCGGGTFRVETTRTPPRMDGKESSIVHATLRHWCEKQEGVIGGGVHITAKTPELCIEAWNRRWERL
jgi:hypothetical protein